MSEALELGAAEDLEELRTELDALREAATEASDALDRFLDWVDLLNATNRAPTEEGFVDAVNAAATAFPNLRRCLDRGGEG
jgi:Xaa-Pro aminopeptidase